MTIGAAALVPAAGRAPDLANVNPQLLATYERIQQRFGQDLPINSGYRSPKRNFQAGGAKRSQAVVSPVEIVRHATLALDATLERHLPILATIASVAPMLGLLPRCQGQRVVA